MEIWKPIAETDSYLVSNYGRVKHIEKLVPYNHAVTNQRHFRLKKEIILKPRITKGYQYVTLHNNNKRICRLVAISFIPNPFGKPEVNHINGIKNDDNVENLEWVTKSENALHALKTGLRDNANKIASQIHSKKVKCLRTNIVFNSIREFAKHRKIDPSNITRALNNTYKNTHDVEFYKG